MTLQIVTTEDGSITCVDAGTGELYHNRAGAFAEAMSNYVVPCALPALLRKQTSLRVLDVCFGLGYNSFVFLQELLALAESAVGTNRMFCLDLLGLDKDQEVLKMLPLVLANPKFSELRKQINRASQSEGKDLIESWQNFGCHLFSLGTGDKLAVRLDLRLVDIREELPRLVLECAKSFDFIFHDGFSARHMPELWTIDLFGEYIKLLKPTGKILTYSSATAVRGAFMNLGLAVRRTSALGGKSGGTLAAFQLDSSEADHTFELSADEQSRLQSRSAIPYRDPSLSDSRAQIVARREKEVATSKLPRFARSDAEDL